MPICKALLQNRESLIHVSERLSQICLIWGLLHLPLRQQCHWQSQDTGLDGPQVRSSLAALYFYWLLGKAHVQSALLDQGIMSQLHKPFPGSWHRRQTLELSQTGTDACWESSHSAEGPMIARGKECSGTSPHYQDSCRELDSGGHIHCMAVLKFVFCIYCFGLSQITAQNLHLFLKAL